MLRFLSTLAVALALFAPAASAAPPSTDEVNTALKPLADAFNKGDAKAAAALFTEDADVISPFGVPGKGRAGAEKVIGADMAGPMKGSTNTFTAETVREIAPNVYLVDATHESQGMTGPDGKKMTGKLHLTLVMVRGKDKKLMVSAARPYMFMPPPPAASAQR